MKLRLWFILAVPLLVFASFTESGAGYQTYWHTMDGGGGISTGSVYSTTITIGQMDASVSLTGSVYSVHSGFWVPQAIQIPGAPFLSIIASASNEVTVSWEPESSDWILQECSDLEIAAWTNSPSGVTNPVVIPANTTMLFYRLNPIE